MLNDPICQKETITLKRSCRCLFSNSVGSDSAAVGIGDDDGAVGDGGAADSADGLGSNALGRNDGMDSVGPDKNDLAKPGNMDVCHHVVPHNRHACNRIAYFFLLSLSI